MRRVIAGWVFACLCLPVFAAAQTSQPIQAPTPHDAAKLLAKLPVHFEAVPGSHGVHHYTASGPGYRVELGATTVHVGLIHGTFVTPQGRETGPAAPFVTSTVSMNLQGANASAPATALEPSSSTSSYFLGDNPTAWHSGVAQFGRLLFADVYPGIDVAYYGNGGQLEHDFIVHAGSDPTSIRLAFPAQHPHLGPEGELVLGEPADGVRLLKPIAYQPGINGAPRREVAVNFELLANGDVTFGLGVFDHTRTLVIDPTLTYASYFGSSNTVINGIAVDGSGNIFIAGLAPTYGIPTKNATVPAGTGIFNAFLTKLDPTGANILFSTYIGGNTQDEAFALALDPSGNAYIAGLTQSTNFPTLHAAQTSFGVSSCYSSFVKCFNGFVTAVKADGSALLYSTYLGGSVDDRVEGIAVDATGAAYLTGYTKSSNFPLKNAYQATLNTNCSNPSTGSCQDAFVTKLDSTGAIVFSTYLGGTGTDNALAIALDSAKNIYVAGSTGSSNFPSIETLTYNGSTLSLFSGAFLTEMAADGQSLVFSHIIATGQGDAIAVDPTGIYVAGSIIGAINATVPTTSGAYSTTAAEMYALKLKPDGSGFLYGTYLGGISGDIPASIVPDTSGNAYVAGFTTSTTYPTTANALQPAATGGFVRSTDAGATFAGASSGLPTCTPAFISLDPAHAGNILTNCGSALYLSTNSGAAWTQVATTGLSGSIVSGFRAQSSSTTLYVLTSSGVYKSTDNGATWTKGAGTGLPTLNGTSQEIAGDPSNASVVYFTQASVGTPLVFRSADGGATWTSASTGLPTSGNLSFLVPDTTNAGTLYAAIGSKIYKTTNSGAAWILPNTTGVTYAIIGLSLDPSNTATVYAGTTFGYFKSIDGATTFTAGNSSFVVNTAITVDPTNSNTLYARLTQAGYYAIQKSTDGGATFHATTFTNAPPNIVVIDPTSNTNVYVGTTQTPTAFLTELDPNGASLLYSSFYGGIGWTEFSALALNSSGNPIAAGLTNSANNTTTNGGAQPSFGYSTGPVSHVVDTGVHPEYFFGVDLSAIGSLVTGPYGGILVHTTTSPNIVLHLADVASPNPAAVGGLVNYTLTATATGGTATNVALYWNSGGGISSPQTTVVSSSSSTFSCTNGPINVACTLTSLAPGTSAVVTITARVTGRAPLPPAVVTDSAHLEATNTSNWAYTSASFTATAQPILTFLYFRVYGTIDRIDNTTPAVVGHQGGFQVGIANNGNAAAINAVVTIPFNSLMGPATLDLATQIECTGGTQFTCTLPMLAPGDFRYYVGAAATNGPAPATFSTSAFFSASNAASVQQYASTPIVNPQTDVAVSTYPGQSSTRTSLTVILTNALNTNGTYNDPASFTFGLAGPSGVPITPIEIPGCSSPTGAGTSTFTCKVTNLAAGATLTLFFSLPTSPSTMVFTATAANVTPSDQDFSNNVAKATITPFTQPPQTVWVSDPKVTYFTLPAPEFISSTQTTPHFTGSGSIATAFDIAGNAWSVGSSKLVEADSSGNLIQTLVGDGITNAAGIAIDGRNNIWIVNADSTVAGLTSAATSITSSAVGASGGGLNQPTAIAVDNAGTIWVTNSGNNSVTRIFGPAAPSVTPLSNANANARFGTLP